MDRRHVQLGRTDRLVHVVSEKMGAEARWACGRDSLSVYGWPKNILHVKGIENSILDLNATIRPHFAIVDAVTAMEGDGPIMGRPRHLGFIGMGADVVAMDATCARIIGLDPRKMPYLNEAGRFLGNLDARRIQHRGEAPSRYAATFDVLDHFKNIRLEQS